MRLFIIATMVVLSASGIFAQAWTPWQIQTPRERRDVSGKGEIVTFSQVDLIAGMEYRIHAEGVVDVSTTEEQSSDARYFIQQVSTPFGPVSIAVPPGTGFPPPWNLTFKDSVKVGLKMQFDVSTEDWFNSPVASSQQGVYQSSHAYDALVTSRGTPLSFRFFDKVEPADGPQFYDDNTGVITIEVSRETPGIAVKYDTLDFGNVVVGQSKRLLDSIQGYGKGYQLDNVFLTGNSAPFSVISERTVPFGLKDATNEFAFTFAPSTTGPQVAHFHLISNSAFGTDKDRIIVLIGNGSRSEITAMTDTLDFGIIAVNATKTLDAFFQNKGNADASIQSALITPSTVPFTVGGLPIAILSAQQAGMPVTFSPTAVGLYFAAIDVQLDDGSSVRFYVKGAAGQGKPIFSSDTLFFDTVIIGLSRVRTTTFLNKEDIPGTGGPLTATHSTNSNPEFSIIGNPGPFTKDPGSGEIYTVTFAPTTHIPNYGLHSGVFTLFFTDQPPKSVYFFGYDHLALEAVLSIDSFYYVVAGKDVTVRQLLKSDLSGTLSPVKQLSQSITYDAAYFELLGVDKGEIISGPEWILNSTLTPGRADISITSATSRFRAGGEMLKLRFRAKPTAPIGAFSYLPQTGVDFGGIIEPLASSHQGKITVTDLCSPVHIRSGSPGTYIEQNNPNPFNPSTRIQFSIGESDAAQHVSLRVYDAAGRLVRVLIDETKSTGVYAIPFDASELPSGVYTYTFYSGEYSETRKMVLIK